jgi:hypothetical protein
MTKTVTALADEPETGQKAILTYYGPFKSEVLSSLLVVQNRHANNSDLH